MRDRSLLHRSFGQLGGPIAAQGKAWVAGACFGAIVLVGICDFLAGRDISLSVFYALPIAITTWFAGGAMGFLFAVVSVLLWIGGDYPTGLQGISIAVPILNGIFRLSFFYLLIAILVRLRSLQDDLASQSARKGEALEKETAERQRLEHELLDVSDREQRRIGQDLHDGLCQHLTGTALTGLALTQKLSEQGLPEAGQAARVVRLVEEAIHLAKGMAKGLYPVEMRADGLMHALEEFSLSTSEMFDVSCSLECSLPVLVHMPASATHLYRIAQEAVANAIKHGGAREIVIVLEDTEAFTRLVISDNGRGFPSDGRLPSGMGLRIMNDRAKMLGGGITILPKAEGGTDVICIVPRESIAKGAVYV